MVLSHSFGTRQDRIRSLRRVSVLLGIAIFFMSGFMIFDRYQDDVGSAEVSAINHAKVLQVQYDASFRRLSAILASLSRQASVQALLTEDEPMQSKAVQVMLDDSIIDFAELNAIRILDAKGDVRYSSSGLEKQGVNSADRSFFKVPRDNPAQTLFFSEIITSRLSGKQTMVVSSAVRNKKGEFLGVMVASIALDKIQAQFRKLDLGTYGSITIRRTDNFALVVRWPHLPAEVNKPLLRNNQIAQKILRGGKQFSTEMVAQTDGRERIFGVSRLEQFPFFVVVAYDTNEVLAHWRKQSLLLGMAVVFILTLLLKFLRHYERSQQSEFDALRDLAQNQHRVRLLAQVFEKSGEAILLLDKQERILEVNMAYIKLTGYTLTEVFQQSWRQFFQASSSKLGPDGGGELICVRKDGSQFPVLHTKAAFLDSDVVGAELAYTIINFADITERKRVEQMKSEFVSTVSHELRTPLTSICGGLGLLVGGALGSLPVPAMKIVHIAHANSLRLSLLINDLLDMEKLAAGKMEMNLETQALMPLVDAAVEQNQAYALAHHVVLSVVQRDDAVQVQADAARLSQVLSNLISNAAKFSPPNSQVEVRVATCLMGKEQENKGGVRVSVRDYGVGVPLQFRERIFQKFAQADSADTRQHNGTGLGLAISKQLIEQMHGEIGFDSELGKGAVFYFELPIQLPPQLATPSAMASLIPDAKPTA